MPHCQRIGSTSASGSARRMASASYVTGSILLGNRGRAHEDSPSSCERDSAAFCGRWGRSARSSRSSTIPASAGCCGGCREPAPFTATAGIGCTPSTGPTAPIPAASWSWRRLRAHTDHPAMAHAGIYAGSQPSVIRSGAGRAASAVERHVHRPRMRQGAAAAGRGRAPVPGGGRRRPLLGVGQHRTLECRHHAGAPLGARAHPRRRRRCRQLPASVWRPGAVLFTIRSAPRSSRKVLAAVERALETERRAVYVIYYNPVHGRLFDASPALTRRWAAHAPLRPRRARLWCRRATMPW